MIKIRYHFIRLKNWFDGLASGRALISDENGNALINAPNTQNNNIPTGTYNVNYKIDFAKKRAQLRVLKQPILTRMERTC